LKYASCKCGHNGKGTKYCDIEGGDDEWTDTFEKVKLIAFNSNTVLIIL
jgi:hypothetical protein